MNAAEEIFAERGYASATMEAIARRAGNSIANVYIYFPGKAAIVEALADAITGADDLSVEHVEKESDAVRKLQIGARILRQLNERSWHVADILRSAQAGDEGLSSIRALWQQRHLDAIQRAITSLDDDGQHFEMGSIPIRRSICSTLLLGLMSIVLSSASAAGRLWPIRGMALPAELHRVAWHFS